MFFPKRADRERPLGHRRVVVRKPVDHVLAVAYVHQRIGRVAFREVSWPCLLAGSSPWRKFLLGGL